MNRKITPLPSIGGEVKLPGSKYVANRLLPLAALASSESLLSNVVDNNDINTAIDGLSALGYRFEKGEELVRVFPRRAALGEATDLYTSHSGTFSRFVTAIAALESVPVKIDCSEKMATRPMIELFDALKQLGAEIESPNQCLPATIKGGVKGSQCRLDASRSSQYLSALLIVSPFFKDGLKIELTGELVSRAYVDMTIKLMELLGVKVIEEGSYFSVKGGQMYRGIDISIPGDPVSSTYFMGAAAISSGKVRINNFDFDSVQGESKFYTVLEKMGVSTSREEDDLIIEGTDSLQAVEVDMGGMPDAVQTLAAVACFAEGTTRITNIAHLAYKESDRINDTANEIRKIGIKVEADSDSLTIYGVGKNVSALKKAKIETHEDHRMAMAMALLGIKVSELQILEADVVGKSFPTYWDLMEQIGVASEEI